MAIVDLVMPKMGESIMEATILRWNKKPGEPVKQEETVLEIATDKVDSEVPSTAEGVLEEVLFQENDVVPVGTVIARIRTEVGSDAVPAPMPAPAPAAVVSAAASEPDDVEELMKAVPYQPQPVTVNGAASSGGARFYSPLVLNIASSEGITLSELEHIPGSGNEGRVTKKDILTYIEHRHAGGVKAAPGEASRLAQSVPAGSAPAADRPYAAPATTPATAPASASAATPAEPAVAVNPAAYSGQHVEIVEMDRMRKLIAKHMVDSKHTSAHVTSFAEADVTNMVLWRERIKKSFEQREGEKITFTPLFIEIIVRCLKRYPWLNSSIDGDKIIIKKDINIGMATALPTGNLIVPVIRNADQLNLVGLTKQVNGLAAAARTGKLKPEDTQGGTFTLTNVGTFGSIMGTPIINQPQVAILAVGAIKKRPVVVETKEGDSIAIRHMMYLSLSYDHRVIDGALGSTFLSAVAKELEHFDPHLTV
ncbi:dihydrolipoamide acetyltransferase family protein [Dinghuibacter silviterrae]|uniref:Dihydrolipoamide acetyltransferase component of pyruvate dehydrogenase complex n=1 Tax=Dinghuibacter silviterrae TaxID=1539049 RepID=A0A4R8DFT4_9BACT|nr:dihydrolipoamide acetyltransferase family protein [Dinghuibacter silviterrae]TDW96473.1 2-oxoglutarate dehydrogenase E2 component (dihydrolipoamide succinyltransferase) [Dinghuibacter silviterrae]